jgi:hypothetical protein
MGSLIFIGVGYVLALAFFRFLGGFGAAGEAFQNWGRLHAERRRKQAASS